MAVTPAAEKWVVSATRIGTSGRRAVNALAHAATSGCIVLAPMQYRLSVVAADVAAMLVAATTLAAPHGLTPSSATAMVHAVRASPCECPAPNISGDSDGRGIDPVVPPVAARPACQGRFPLTAHSTTASNSA